MLGRYTMTWVYVWMAVALCVAIMPACGAARPFEARITAPEANAQIPLDSELLIQGDVNGDGIVRVEVMVDGAISAALSTGDPNRGVDELPVQVAWRSTLVGTHIVQFRVYGLGGGLMGSSEAVIFAVTPAGTARPAASVQPTATPHPQAVPTVAPSEAMAAPTAVPTSAPASPTLARPAATAQPAEVTVTGESANVREGPGTTYPVLGQLAKNDVAVVRGKSGDGQWWQITFPKGGSGLGWVSAGLVQATVAAYNVAVAQAPPTPTSAPVTPTPAASPTSAAFTPQPPAYAGPPCDESSPYWRGKNASYPFCVMQDFLWGDPNGDWAIYDNGKNIPLSASWNLFGANIESIRLRFDPVDGYCPFNRPHEQWIDQPVQPADTYRFNVADFPSGAAFRVYLLVKLKDGRSVTFGEKRVCIN